MAPLLRDNDPMFMTAVEAAQRKGYASKSELALREALEHFIRSRHPNARICHEMVMGEGRVRADVVAIDTSHILAFEVKGQYDDTTRLLHQVGMYQLCVPEVWMVVPTGRHAEDARALRYLLPSVGLLVGSGQSTQNYYEFGIGFELKVEAEAVPRPPLPEMTLQMLWRQELIGACQRQNIEVGPKTNRKDMIRKLMQVCTLDTLRLEVCTELRGRDAVWRADPPIEPEKGG